MTEHQNPASSGADGPPQSSVSPESHEVLAVSIAAAVERQLTHYMSAMVQQVETARRSAETGRAELRAEFAHHVEELAGRIESQRSATEAYQRALQAALEERLAEFANHQHVRLTEVDARIARVSHSGDVPAQIAAATQGWRDYVENQTSALDARLNELHKSTNRFDEQANALVQHVNQTTQTLVKRIDDGDQRVTTVIGERFAGLGELVEGLRTDLEAQLVDHRAMLVQRVDTAEMKYTDRMLALEERVNETHGTKIASLEATIGRIGAGFDEALSALSQRAAELHCQLIGVDARLDQFADQLNKVDSDGLDRMKEQLSAAIGEAMLVRIEVDRVVASTDEKLDKHSMRMAEIEARFSDEMDVGTAVQLERLDELERAVAALDPDQFVRKVDPNAPALRSEPKYGNAYGNAYDNAYGTETATTATDQPTTESSYSSY